MADGNHNGNGDSRPAQRGPNGRFLAGNRGGPGSPLAKQAVNARSIWLAAVKAGFTAELAKGVFDRLVDIACNAERDRDAVGAAAELLSRIGVAKNEDVEESAGVNNYTVVMSFTNPPAKPTPSPEVPRLIDQHPA
jgi:hypothetical protein